MRTKNQIHVLSGHQGTVWAMETQATDPQIITGSSDSTVKVRIYSHEYPVPQNGISDGVGAVFVD